MAVASLGRAPGPTVETRPVPLGPPLWTQEELVPAGRPSRVLFICPHPSQCLAGRGLEGAAGGAGDRAGLTHPSPAALLPPSTPSFLSDLLGSGTIYPVPQFNISLHFKLLPTPLVLLVPHIPCFGSSRLKRLKMQPLKSGRPGSESALPLVSRGSSS